ncbi:putative zinc-binding protein [Candidatus Bathyarchaeota archaeon]|nr:putative zinc-binding protein [Candidatus Bathyarchaeota archaeon]
MSAPKIGVVSCSGECCVEGTISRIATRFVLEKLRPDNTVTTCLPLFSIGDKGEKMFTKHFPTIAVDGCEKRCAKKAIEKYSGKTVCSIVVTELLKKWDVKNPSPRRELNKEGLDAASKVADEIAAAMDKLFAGGR